MKLWRFYSGGRDLGFGGIGSPLPVSSITSSEPRVRRLLNLFQSEAGYILGNNNSPEDSPMFRAALRVFYRTARLSLACFGTALPMCAFSTVSRLLPIPVENSYFKTRCWSSRSVVSVHSCLSSISNSSEIAFGMSRYRLFFILTGFSTMGTWITWSASGLHP